MRSVTGVTTIGVLIRNSTGRQVGNYRSEKQYDLGPRIEGRGCQVRYYDEQGTSGSDLSKRKVTMRMLDDMAAGEIQGIAAYDFKRLTRDEFGVDGATIARRIVEAGGRFHTWDREYNLRLDEDLLQFQFQCLIAGLDWRNIRNTLWSGIFKKMEQEPHYTKTPLGYMNVADAKGKKHVAKNPAHGRIIDALAELFEECDSLGEMARILNTRLARPEFRGHGGPTDRWTVFGLRYILKNTIYAGVYTAGTSLGGRKQRSTVWDRFGMDDQGNPKDFTQHRPDLAWWDPATVRRWQKKFGKPSNARVRKDGHQAALAGVLECSTCSTPMIAHGSGTYACPAVGTGRGPKGVVCEAPQMIVENVVLQILRQELPRALGSVQGLAEAARAQVLERPASATSQRIVFLEERRDSIKAMMWSEQTDKAALPELTADLGRVASEIAQLREKVTEEEDAQVDREALARTCDALLANPVEAFDGLDPADQARVYRLLFANVRIEIRGFASGRQWRLQQYRATIGGELHVTRDAAWGTRRNPKSKLEPGESRETVIFAPTNLVSYDAGREYAPYLASMRRLAAFFAAA